MKSDSAALVLFSGGQDSTVCLAYALDHYPRVETVGFDYGQRHSVEMQCRQAVLREMGRAFPAWAARLGPDHVLYGSDAPPLTSLKPRAIKLIKDLDIPTAQREAILWGNAANLLKLPLAGSADHA